ncbi:MAG: TonB-dependent receptor [Acidobacteria bacterium]|nr:TonB-dependent receptor [Acidobacteriota bacterium]
MFTSKRSFVFAALCAAVAFSGWCFAQESRGAIAGTITDQQGAIIPAASVKLLNQATGAVITTQSNESGAYVAPFVSIGEYTITASAKGFKSAIRDKVEVRVGDRLQIDFRLEVGNMTEQITVSAEAELVEASTASRGQVIDSAKVSDLPLLGRNPFMLAAISTGVQYPQSQASRSNRPFDNGGMDNLQINGGKGFTNELLLDGVPNTNVETGQPSNLSFVPSPDATEEFKVQTNTYDAQYGRTGGGTVNVALKSGTNRLRGSAYYYFRHDKLNANTFESNLAGIPKSAFRWAQPGVEVDGPVYIPKLYDGRNRTFFMYSWERIKSSIPFPQTYTVPTPDQRAGNFATTPYGTGQYITIYDPLTTVQSGSGYTRTPFAGNLVPSSRIDPVAKKLLDWIPTPTTAGNSLGQFNLIASPNPRTDTYDQHIIRIDHTINSKHKFFSRYIRGNRHEVNSDAGFKHDAAPWYTHWRINQGGNFDLTSMLKPTLVSSLRAGYIRHQFAISRYGDGFDSSQLGFPSSLAGQLPRPFFPQFAYTDYTTFGNTGSQFTFSDTWSISETLNQVIGKHSIKYGGEFRTMFNNQQNPTSSFGNLTFNKGFTQRNPLAGDSASGNAFASLLLGYPASGNSPYNNAPALNNDYWVVFFQDDWRISQRLTLNLGLRWDYESPQTDRYDRLNAGFDPTAASKLAIPNMSLKGGLLFASSSQRFPFQADRNNFQPRAGFAYQITPRTVVRGGYGMSYLPTFDINGTNGYSVSTPFVSSNNGGLTPADKLANPYPAGIIKPSGSSLGVDTLAGSGYTYGFNGREIPFVHQFSLGVQHELPMRILLDVSYSGSRTSSLNTSKGINEISADAFKLGATVLNRSVANPFAGYLPGTSLNAATTTTAQLLRPFPQFTGITEANRSIGELTYDSLQTRVEKRFSRGFHALVSYTYSKNMERTGYLNAQDSIGSMARTYAQYDTPHRLITSGGWSMPFFRSHGNAFVRQLLGGWDINAIVTFQSGLPIAAPGSTFSTGTNAKYDTRTRERWFNTCTLTTAGALQNCPSGVTTPVWGIMPAYTLRTLSGYQPGIRTQRAPMADVGLFKTFTLRESLRLQFRAESFNIANSVWFGAPNLTVTSGAFGTVSPSQANDPRNIQLALRLLW